MDFQPYNEALHNVTVWGFWLPAIVGVIIVFLAGFLGSAHVGDEAEGPAHAQEIRIGLRRCGLLLAAGLGALLVAATFLGVGATFPSGRAEALANYSQQAKERYGVDVSPDNLARTGLGGTRPSGAQFYFMTVTFGGTPTLIIEDPQGVLTKQSMDAAYDGEKVLLGSIDDGVFTELKVIR